MTKATILRESNYIKFKSLWGRKSQDYIAHREKTENIEKVKRQCRKFQKNLNEFSHHHL